VVARSKAWVCGRSLAGIAAWMSVMGFVCCQVEVCATGRLSLVRFSFLLVQKIGDLYRLDVAECKYGNQIAQSPTIFEREAFKVKNHISINPLNAELNPTCHLTALVGAHHILHISRVGVKIYVPVQEPSEKYTLDSEPESEEASLEAGKVR